MEYVNKITGYVLALVLGAILVGGLLIPTVEGIQETVGNPATLDNNMVVGASYDYALWDGSDITLEYTKGTSDTPAVYTINGEALTIQSTEQRIIIASNDFAARSGGALVPILHSQYKEVTTSLDNVNFSFTVVDKEYTLILNNVTYTGSVDWMVYAVTDGDLNLNQIRNTNVPFYTSKSDDMIVLGNVYTTGDNDTFYSYYDGQLTVNEDYAAVSSVDIVRTVADGYTDIYETTITVNVGDESFTPFFILAPKTVSGHVAGGTYYIMFGVISLLAIVMLVVIAANAIRTKY